MTVEGLTQQQEDALRKILKAEKDRYAEWSKQYIVEILGYIDRGAADRVKGRRISCQELVGLCKVGAVEKNVQIRALMNNLKEAHERLARVAQVDCFEGCAYSQSSKLRKKA